MAASRRDQAFSRRVQRVAEQCAREGRPVRVVVLGGGVSGLVVARQLRVEMDKMSRSRPQSVSVEIEVLEASDRAGGWLRSEVVASASGGPGFLFERGARGVRPRGTGRRALRLIESLGLEKDAITTAAEGEARWVLHNGRPVQLPASPADLLRRGLPMISNAVGTFGLEFTRAAHPSSLARGGPGTPDESVHDFFTRRFGGPQLADSLLDAVVAGVWAGDVKELSAQSLFPLPTAWEDAVGSIQGGAVASILQSFGVPLPSAVKQRLDLGGGSRRAAALGAGLEAQDIREGPASSFVRSASKSASVSFVDGMGALPNALVEDLGGAAGEWRQAAGGRSRVRVGTRCLRIERVSRAKEPRGSGATDPSNSCAYQVRAEESASHPGASAQEVAIPFDLAVSALPAPVLADLLESSASDGNDLFLGETRPHQAVEALRGVPYASVVSVSVGLRGDAAAAAMPPDRRGFGYLCPSREEKSVLGCVWDSCAFPSQQVVPAGAESGVKEARLSVMMGGARNPSLVSASDEEVVAVASDALLRHMDINLGADASLADGLMISRASNAIPQYSVGHQARMACVDTVLGDAGAPEVLQGLGTVGNWRGGVGVADAVAQGEAFGVAIARGIATAAGRG